MSQSEPSEPKYPRFEVEDIESRQNYTFVLGGGMVRLYNTSRGRGNILMEEWGPGKEYPFNHNTAESFYRYLFNKSLKAIDNICFIGYVDENFQPINPDPDDEGSE